MLYIYQANVKDGKLKELQKWFKENEKNLDSSLPNSWRLKGGYFPVLGFGPAMFEIHWELDGYESLAHAHSLCLEKCDKEINHIQTLYSFLDVSNQNGRLLKDITDKNTLVQVN